MLMWEEGMSSGYLPQDVLAPGIGKKTYYCEIWGSPRVGSSRGEPRAGLRRRTRSQIKGSL